MSTTRCSTGSGSDLLRADALNLNNRGATASRTAFMNHDLERELEKAFRRHEPSDDFAERVMARLAEQSPVVRVDARRETVSWWQRLAGFFQMPQVRWAAAGALACLLVAVGTLRYREHQRLEAERIALEQAEGERAKEQVILALQIASAKLNVAQRKVRESSERGAELR